ncbi:winged helix-turn-helix domain-containing protein [Fulvivirgaceae bacterium BMA10]|uniref:Winged helix-turn-helix domain-containing protein n=1 Tax=Splendidivirga corallicola TaxID=3051826 RepID=A0ABT8KTD5_9BACT|nr:winged helix-turn-helix domain-containing protein [Fulvivirgaceae bacterium BMA10]
MKLSIILTTVLLTTTILFSATVLLKPDRKEAFLEKRAHLVVREIGHRLLLHAGDSASRLLPVQQLPDGVFQITFQNELSFKPDSLVRITQETLAQSNLSLNYMVNVFDCKTNEIVYGFEIRPTESDIVPCLGRTQPNGCYTVRITFYDLASSPEHSQLYYLAFIVLTGLTLFAFIGKTLSKTKKQSAKDNAQPIAIGRFEFNESRRILKNNNEIISLSDKETKLLRILATNQNQLLTRDYLLHEVWESEGVITGRSLDMFISKLRKKLSSDDTIQITNVHGKGYKLEVV